MSKTTTTFHLGHALSEFHKKKVLWIDADPQCNLTELCLTPLIEELDLKAEETGEDYSLPGTTILDALGPRLDGARADVDVESIQLVQPDPAHSVFLLRGDVALSEAEDKLSYAHSQRLTTDMHQRRNYVAIHDMARRLAARDNFDVVLLDVGPSAGALTRSCFLSCDEFLVPVAPDRFNYQAIRTLSRILDKWIREHQMVVNDFQKMKLNISARPPQFRGLVMQRFQRYRGAPKPGFRHWMKRIPERTTQMLLPELVSATGDKSVVYPECFNQPTLVEIPDFSSLAPMMLTAAKPVWRLTKQDTGFQGVVWEQREQTMKECAALFEQVAGRLLA